MDYLPLYLLKVNLVFTVLLAVYYVALRKEKFLTLNRFVLLGIFVTAIVLPLGPELSYAGIGIKGGPTTEFTAFYSMIGVKPGTQEPVVIHTENDSRSLYLLLWKGYLFVAFALLVRFMLQLFQLYFVISRSNRKVDGKVVYCNPSEELPPFSFFKYIVVKNDGRNPQQYRHIIAHELSHSSQLHSIDVLIAEMACILFWFNPFSPIYRRLVKLNLEFLADEQAANSGVNRKAYQLDLLQVAIHPPKYHLVSSFHASGIKHRISMMNTEHPLPNKRYKFALLLAAIAAQYLVLHAREARSSVKDATRIFFKRQVVTKGPDHLGFKQDFANHGIDYKNQFRGRPGIAPWSKSYPQNQPSGHKLLQSTHITIDARTDTVKFRIVADVLKDDRPFNGIYIVEGKPYTADQLKKQIGPTGKLDIVFAERQLLRVCTHSTTETQKLGKLAENGVISLLPRTDIALTSTIVAAPDESR